MKLLIDEMYPPIVAAQLRRAGHDVMSIAEDPELAGLEDTAVRNLAVATQRAVVTENAADFLPILRERSVAGLPVPTLIATSNRSFPRHVRSFVGRAVRALGSFCDAHTDDDPQAGAVHWLRPTT
ncbi:MAG: DUF5615 family PIN-like protein [Mycobacteriales bacterium]